MEHPGLEIFCNMNQLDANWSRTTCYKIPALCIDKLYIIQFVYAN